jgi:membrane associated rhomboid family serine protease
VIPLHDENPTRNTPWVTILLIVVCVGVYFFVEPGSTEVQATAEFNYRNAAVPCEVVSGEPLTVIEIRSGLLGQDHCSRDDALPPYYPDKHVLLAVLVSMFLHGSILHLGGNMLFLWIFGNNVEDRLGPLRYVAFYVIAGIVATLAHIVAQPNSTVPVVGASGAIAGVMGAYLIWFPHAQVQTLLFVVFFVLFPVISARWLLLFWFVSQFFVNPNEGVAWVAHVGGFVFGVLIALLLRRSSEDLLPGDPGWAPPAAPPAW